MKKQLQDLFGIIPDDKSDVFRHSQRVHQGWWRTFVLAEKPGLHPTRNTEKICNTIVKGEETGNNFLTNAAKLAVQETLEKRDTFSSGMIAPRRLYNNLLSSQPMCFNLFGELRQDKTLVLEILRNYLPGIEQVTQVMFEYAPKGYTGDNSAFDVAIKVAAKNGNGLLGFECKYTDDFSYKNKQRVVYGAPNYKNRVLYEQIFYQSNCFLHPFDEYVKDRRVNQLFRNQLIAEALVQKHEDEYAFVTTGLVYHESDEEARESGLQFQNMLRDGKQRFQLITIQSFIENAQRLKLDWETRVWTMKLWARYCGNELSDNVTNSIRESE